MIFSVPKTFRGILFAVQISLTMTVVGLFGGSSWGLDADTSYSDEIRSGRETGGGKIPFPKPDSHNGNWIEFHGALKELNINVAGQKGKSCYDCHKKNDCIDCHNTMMPRDHTNTWRSLSHGFMATGNRERCLTCHKQDYCVRCHNETAPRTHRANWIAGHCTACHFSSGFVPGDNCGVCHPAAPHTSAPHPVSAQLDCTRCHR